MPNPQGVNQHSEAYKPPDDELRAFLEGLARQRNGNGVKVKDQINLVSLQFPGYNVGYVP